MPSVEVNGIALEYEITGDGEPVLFVMGLGGQLTDWPAEFVDLFVDAGYRIIRFDNRDIGLSTQTDWIPPSRRRTVAAMMARRPLKGAGYTMIDMADDAAGLLDALDIDSAHIVGISMGGMIAQELAINHPTKVRSLCSIMSNTGDRRHGGIAFSLARKFVRGLPDPTLETAVEESVTLFAKFAGDHYDPEEQRKLATLSVTRSFTPAGVARQTAAIGATPDRTARLTAVTSPTLVIHGLQDPLVRPSGGIATAKAIAGSQLLMLPDMGHDLPRPRRPEMCDAIVANFDRAAS